MRPSLLPSGAWQSSDEASRDFAREYSDELWVQPAEAEDEQGPVRGATTEFWVMLGFALAAALAIKVPALFGYQLNGDDASFYARNLSFFVLPFLAMYFIWKRGLSTKGIVGLAAVFVAGAVFANVYPFTPGGSTEVLTAIHLPVVLWLTVGVAYVAGDWLSDARRMEYVRFTGEWLITYALIALGGGVLVAITVGVFQAIGLDVSTVISEWVLPCGAMGAVIVAAWLVGSGRNLVGGMAPMLARVFTPLFALMLVALLVGVVWTRGVINIEREVLIIFDVLLVVVLALLLYAISARDPLSPPGALRLDPARACGVRSGRGRVRPDQHRRPLVRVRVQREQDSRTGPESHPAGQLGVVGVPSDGLLEIATQLRSRRALADALPSRVRAVGCDHRRGLPAAVRLRLAGEMPFGTVATLEAPGDEDPEESCAERG